MDQQADTVILQWFQVGNRLIAVALIILCTILLLARYFEIEQLTIATGGAALGMLFCALSLLGFGERSEGRIRQGIGYAFAILAASLGGMNLGRYFLGLELVNVFSELEVKGFQPATLMAMSPSDSIMITLVAMALLLMNVSVKGLRISELIAFTVTLASVMTLLGVILKIDTFCMFYACARISPVVGIAFGFLGVATLCARPTEGFVSLLLSKNAGGISARRLIPSALAIPLLVSSLRMYVVRLGLPEDLGIAFMVACMMMLFALLLCWNAWSIERLDMARQLAILKAKESEMRTRMVIQQAIDAFVAVDAEGIIKDWNERAATTFGFAREEVLGQPLFELVVPERLRSDAKLAIKQLLQHDQVTTSSKPLESYAIRKDGSEFPAELSLFPVAMESESLLCGFVRDITERKVIEHRFKEFYATVSHELKSPLTSVKGCLAMVKELSETLPETAGEMLKIADNSLDRLGRLINDMLDVKKIEEGQLQLDKQLLDPVDIVSLATDGLRGMASRAQVELEVIIEDASTFIGDADRIVQVLTNLIANAIRFTPRHMMVVVRVSRSKNQGYLRFLVQDQGPGIALVQMPKLFNKFAQLADGKSKFGTGLGLSISKAIVEEHGGQIGVESRPNQGASFWFELPFKCDRDLKGGDVESLAFHSADKES